MLAGNCQNCEFHVCSEMKIYGHCVGLEPVNEFSRWGIDGGTGQNHTRYKILISNVYLECVSPLLAPIYTKIPHTFNKLPNICSLMPTYLPTPTAFR
jgi:hypothetical protein